MPRISLKNPPKGANPISDAIRERRGTRGLTPLDQVLLNAPEVANGWNTLLGALRNRSSLPGDIRELLILRVAARNRAVFEWIHHAHVGLDEGLTAAQLLAIRDTAASVHALPSILSPFQQAALRFADHSTLGPSVPEHVLAELRTHLSGDQQLLEATATVACYNMVSRVLLTLDVGDYLYETFPIPETTLTETRVPVPAPAGELAAAVFVRDPTLPYVVFVNSLLTTRNMWQYVLPKLSEKYNLVIYDQRGHGKSSVPAERISMDTAADDIPALLKGLDIPTPVHAIVGVSQGGATTLNAAKRHPGLAHKIVVCDTQATSPAANAKAWDDRIALATANGMSALADVTVPRWFAETDPNLHQKPYMAFVYDQVANTTLEGFRAGAQTLQGYDVAPGLGAALKGAGTDVLLLAGEKDGALPKVLSGLNETLSAEGVKTRFEAIKNAGHLPMLDQPASFLEVVGAFLA